MKILAISLLSISCLTAGAQFNQSIIPINYSSVWYSRVHDSILKKGFKDSGNTLPIALNRQWNSIFISLQDLSRNQKQLYLYNGQDLSRLYQPVWNTNNRINELSISFGDNQTFGFGNKNKKIPFSQYARKYDAFYDAHQRQNQ